MARKTSNRIKQASEPEAATRAFNDYYELGPNRTLARLARTYRQSAGEPPTRSLATLKEWSTRWQWQARVETLVQQELSVQAEQRANARWAAGEIQGQAAMSFMARPLAQWQRHSQHWMEPGHIASDEAVAKGEKLQGMVERAQKMQRLALGLPTAYTREERDFQLLDFMLQETRSILMEEACPDCLARVHARYKDLDATIAAMGGRPVA